MMLFGTFKIRRAASAMFTALLLTSVAMPSASAAIQQSEQQREDERRRSQTLGPRAGKALNEALNLANEDPPQTEAALAEVNQLLQRELPPFDRATALEVRGQLNYQLDREEAALNDFVQVLRIDALPSDRQRQIRRNVAQLYYTQEQFDRAINFMQTYIQEAGAEAEANDYFILAAAYVQKNDFRNARRPAEQAVELDQQSGDRNKQFYDLLNLVYNELGLEAERGRLLETMVEYFPGEESYWVQLASAYSAADRRADALAALEVAYKAGLIEDEEKILTLSQFYYDQNNPFRGAKLLSSEMEAGNVDRDLSNLELLAQLWAAAREQDEAIAILTEAAPKRNDGRLFYQLGQSYFADEEFDAAVSNLRRAIQRGGLDGREVGQAHILIGTALFQSDTESAEARAAARAEFVQATDYDTARKVAQNWVDYIDLYEDTLRRQNEVEFSQAVERQRREIERCGSLIDVIELGGRTDVPEERIEECRNLLQEVEEGATAESLVRAEQAANGDGDAEGEDANAG